MKDKNEEPTKSCGSDGGVKKHDENTLPLKSRRHALRATLAGGAVITTDLLPGTWVKPVIESALIPAHAVTSQVVAAPSSGGNNNSGGDTMGNGQANIAFTFTWTDQIA